MSTERILGGWLRAVRVHYLRVDAAALGARCGLSAVAVLRQEEHGPSVALLQSALDLRVEVAATYPERICPVRGWTVEEWQAAAEVEARLGPVKVGRRG